MTQNSSIYIQKKKQNIEKNKINFVNVNPDGNCFYYCLSEFLFSNSLHHRFIRNAVSLFCKKNKEKIIEFQRDVEIRNNIFISTDEYINLIGNNGNWAIDIDIYVSSIIFELI